MTPGWGPAAVGWSNRWAVACTGSGGGKELSSGDTVAIGGAVMADDGYGGAVSRDGPVSDVLV